MSSFIDLHIHTDASDGTDTPEQVLEKILDQGIHTFAITDHDTVAGSLAMGGLVPPEVRFIPGIEFSCRAPLGKCHILGYGFDLTGDVFWEAVNTARRRRMDKLGLRLAFLETQFGILLTQQEMDWLMSRPSPGKPNLAQILVERGLAKNIDDAIQRYINPCKGGDDRIPAELAVRGILGAGGIPIWAHPLGGEGERRISREEFGRRLAELMAYGIRGLECCYSRYDDDDIEFLLSQSKAHGLLVSGGSDYHGGNKVGISLGKLNAAGKAVTPERLTVLEALKCK